MSLTLFFALCILGIDFMIYFFFKLVYGEKRRVSPRRLPPEFYDDLSYGGRRNKSSLYLVPGRKEQPKSLKRILSMPTPKRKSIHGATGKQPVNAGRSRTQSAEPLAYRHIYFRVCPSQSPFVNQSPPELNLNSKNGG